MIPLTCTPPFPTNATKTGVERAICALSVADLNDLCDAAELAIRDGGGFGWLTPPPRDILERFWQGVIAMPSRMLLLARLEGIICGAAQVVRPPPNNEAQAHSAQLTGHFMAPWARGHGLAHALVKAAEAAAQNAGVKVMNLDVRTTQSDAICLYESMNYICFGTHPAYARVEGQSVLGHFYYKILEDVVS